MTIYNRVRIPPVKSFHIINIAIILYDIPYAGPWINSYNWINSNSYSTHR